MKGRCGLTFRPPARRCRGSSSTLSSGTRLGLSKEKFLSRSDVGLLHKLHRLRHVSKSELPRLAVSRTAHRFHSSFERWLYTVKGSRFQKTPKSLRPVGLFHPDPLSTGFSSRFRSENAAETESIIKRADQAVDLVFDLLGSGPT